MTYVGWKIWAYTFHPSLRIPSEREILSEFHTRFVEPEWFQVVTGNRAELTHNPTQNNVKVEIHPEDLTVDGTTETYAVTLVSHCFAWKQSERDHKDLLSRVMQMLPWRKAAAFIDDGGLVMVHWYALEEGDEGTLTATARRCDESVLPRRRRILREVGKRRISRMAIHKSGTRKG